VKAEDETGPQLRIYRVNGRVIDSPAGRLTVDFGLRDLLRALVRRRLVVEMITGEDSGRGSWFAEKRLDRPGDPVSLPAPAETLSLPGGTVLTGADHDALVTRFTAHARVLIGNGLCPMHEMPLDPVRLDPARPQSHRCAGECDACGRCWFTGSLTPYAIDGMSVTGGEPLQRDGVL
jgi:hypothetical protein